jgi:hypothetical protein
MYFHIGIINAIIIGVLIYYRKGLERNFKEGGFITKLLITLLVAGCIFPLFMPPANQPIQKENPVNNTVSTAIVYRPAIMPPTNAISGPSNITVFTTKS